MKTLFLFPTGEEAAPFRAACPDAEIRITGVGMAAAAAAVARIAAEEPRGSARIVLCGIAGACDGTLRRGEVVQVTTERIAELPERYGAVYRASWHFDGLREAAGCSVNRSAASRGCCPAGVENMEGAAVMAACAAAGIPCGEIRAVSNCVGEPFERWQIARALENLTETLTKIYHTL